KDLLLLGVGQFAEVVRRVGALAAMQPDRVVQRISSSIVHVGRRIRNSPKRWRAPLAVLRALGFLEPGKLQRRLVIRAAANQQFAHLMQQQIAVQTVYAAETGG